MRESRVRIAVVRDEQIKIAILVEIRQGNAGVCVRDAEGLRRSWLEAAIAVTQNGDDRRCVVVASGGDAYDVECAVSIDIA